VFLNADPQAKQQCAGQAATDDYGQRSVRSEGDEDAKWHEEEEEQSDQQSTCCAGLFIS
jgi:hypothetical protein